MLILRVLIIKKFARFLNGVDLDTLKVGDVVDLPDAIATMLVHEGWAEFANAKTVPATDTEDAGRDDDDELRN